MFIRLESTLFGIILLNYYNNHITLNILFSRNMVESGTYLLS